MFAVPSWCEAGKNGSPTLLVDNQYSQKGNGSCRESSNASERERERVCVVQENFDSCSIFYLYGQAVAESFRENYRVFTGGIAPR